MIYYFYGSDTYAAREAIGQLAKEHSAAIHWLDKEDFDREQPAFWFSRGAKSLLGREMMVLRDPSQMALGLRDEISQALNNSSAIVVLWERRRLDKNDDLYRRYQSNVRVFNTPSAAEVAGWLAQEAIKRGGTMAVDAARLLVERIGLDKWQLIGELDKLLLCWPAITVKEVEQTDAAAAQAEIFAALDALARGDRRQAISGIQTLLAGGASEFYILSMLAYQFRILLLVRSGQDRGLKQFDVVKEGKLKTYAVQKNWPHAAKKPLFYWRDALTRVLATDVAIKQGKMRARTAILMLAAKLA